MQLMSKLSVRLNRRGDTLVEVLIAIGIISTVLAGAYVMTNRSLISTRDAQERVNATKLAETQLELIKSAVAKDPNIVFATGVPTSFCAIPTATSVAIYQSSDTRCTQMDANGTSPVTTQPRFTIVDTRTNNDFMVKVTWVSAGGVRSNDNVQLRYRVY